MSVITLYARNTAVTDENPFTANDALPSPVSLKSSRELIWSQNTGRAQSGENKAMMVGDVVAQKRTYTIEWDMLYKSQLDVILDKLHENFFYFGVATSPPSSAVKYYRSEIQYDMVQVADSARYRNVTITVIER